MPRDLSRREFFATSAALAAAGLGHAAGPQSPRGKVEHCVMVWLGGGACAIDTWDPQPLGDPKRKKPGGYYPSIPTAVRGVRVCEHLKRCADIMDRFTVLRTVHHDVVDEHAAATNRMHTGRPTSGTVVYPSLGSVVAHERGAAGDGCPAYVLIGYPNITRGPGFLGAKANYVYLTDTKSGPAGLTRPESITPARQARREKLLAAVRGDYRKQHAGDKQIADYDDTVSELLRLAGPRFASVFDLEREPADLRNDYGGEFGQRCLLARRLIERGTRFVEVSHNLNFVNGTGWDTHRDGQLNQHLLIRELDQALSAMVRDLEAKKLLDKTLIVVSTEFGRPAKFDAAGGRGHHAKCFSVVLAGGGLKHRGALGRTSNLGMKVAGRPVSVPDLFATVHASMGIDPHKNLYAGERPVPITDNGEPLGELFG